MKTPARRFDITLMGVNCTVELHHNVFYKDKFLYRDELHIPTKPVSLSKQIGLGLYTQTEIKKILKQIPSQVVFKRSTNKSLTPRLKVEVIEYTEKLINAKVITLNSLYSKPKNK